MALTPSTMLELGTALPSFRLQDPSGNPIASSDFADAQALVVAFICNHCPFVKHIAAGFADFARDVGVRGVAVAAINANDAATHPEDSPAKMAQEVQRRGYDFPYLFDEAQEVAKLFRAACTPEFYLFDARGLLVYRGQFDGSRPGNDVPVTGEDLRSAVDAVLAGEPPSDEQKPSIGCNIKWKPGNAPDYF